MKRLLLIAALLAAPAALAQEITQPRYYGLEMQQQMLEQRGYDQLERQRLNEQTRSLTDPTRTPAETQLRLMELDRQRERMLLQSQQDRALIERERIVTESNRPLRRIAPSSVLVVTQPELYALPKLPSNKFYARLDGRFVVVDRASELVEKVLPEQPGDPTSDVPAGPRPMPLPAIPVDTMLRLGLPTPAPGQYYARKDSDYVLVDRSTAQVLKVMPQKAN